MKFYCDKCNAKYSIADEKVRGKILKVRCKKCANIITVREPRTPVGQALAPSGPVTSSLLQQDTAVPWYYSINGQTFGPFPLDKLQAMYAHGEVGDASYVWNETFTAWLPVREVQEFSDALATNDAVRPASMTLGATGQIQAIQAVDAQPNEAEDGFVPTASPPPDQLSDRLEGLRGKLQVSANPFGAVEEESFGGEESSLAELSSSALLESNDLQDSTPDAFSLPPRPSFTDDTVVDPPEGLFEEGVAPTPMFSLPETSEEPSSFRGVESAQFPSLSRDSVETGSVHDGMFQDIQVDSTEPVGRDDDFAPTQSLLIELDSIQKDGRSKRVALFGAIASVFLVLAVTASVLAYRRAQQPVVEKEVTKVAQKDDLVFHKYSKEELQFMKLGDEVLTEEESRKLFEEEEPAPKKNVPKGTKPKKLATNTKPTKKTDLGSKGLNLRGTDFAPSSSASAFDRALDNAAKSRSKTREGLKSSSSNGGTAKAITGDNGGEKKAGTSPKWDRLKIGSTARPRKVYRPTDNIGSSKSPKGTGFSSTKLSKADAKAGFAKIRRSVGFCRQRQSMRGLPLSAQKITVTVEIQGTGSVSSLKLAPSSVRNTEFHNCMKSHKSRWRFVAYNGDPVKIQHTYVLQ